MQRKCKKRADTRLCGYALCAKDSKAQRVIASRGKTGGLQAHLHIPARSVQMDGQAVIAADSASLQFADFRPLLRHAREPWPLHTILPNRLTDPRCPDISSHAAIPLDHRFHAGIFRTIAGKSQPLACRLPFGTTRRRVSEAAASPNARRSGPPLRGQHTTVKVHTITGLIPRSASGFPVVKRKSGVRHAIRRLPSPGALIGRDGRTRLSFLGNGPDWNQLRCRPSM